MTQDSPTYTYRGRSLEELVPRIREELGDDAVIIGRRETTSGGVGGFFAKREIEVDVRPGESTAPAQAFRDQLAAAHQRQAEAEDLRPRPEVGPQIDALPSAADVSVDDLFPPAPPQQSRGLAALFNAGLEPGDDEQELRAERAPEAPAPEAPAPEAPAPEAPAPEARASEAAAEPVIEVDQPTGAFDFLQATTPAAEPVPVPEPEPVMDAELVTDAEPVVEEELFLEPPSRPDPVGSDHGVREADVAPIHVGPAARDAAAQMAGRGLRPELAETVATEAILGLLPFTPDADPRELVLDALARRIPILPLRHGPGVVGFVGPGGAGKTRCVARLAAAYARHSELPVAVITLHSPDEGSELTRLLAPYGTELHAVTSGAEGAAKVAALRGEALVIVDTPGVSPRNPGELQALGAELRALAPDELHLAVPATIGPDAARELVGGVRELGVDALALTHTDETEQLGTVVGLAIDARLPLSYLARGQAVDAGLKPATAPELARCLMP